ncbi:MAG: hypothetical protein VYE35_01215, partial [Chloroflexota bacterium]|nr:hypothetical protein [Chloroflexota bacterium]
PRRQEGTFFVEDGYTIQKIVRGVYVAIAVQIYGPGPDELAVSPTTRAELAQELMVTGHTGDALADFLYATVDDIDKVIRPEREVLGSPETLPRHPVHADTVTIIEYAPCGDGS